MGESQVIDRSLDARVVKKTHLFTGFFIVWATIILLRLSYIMIIDRDTVAQRYEYDSWRLGVVPALRGRILDKSGEPLAWSLRRFSLYYEVAQDDDLLSDDVTQIDQIIPVPFSTLASAYAGDVILIKDNLTPGQVIKLQKLTSSSSRVRIKGGFTRVYRAAGNIREKIGRTALINHREVGVSGYEKKYNSTLSGFDGKYRVMVDKNDNWIAETWREIQNPVPGYDVYISPDQ